MPNSPLKSWQSTKISKGGILYHYCDATAFQSIVSNNELWLCPFDLSNDSLEGEAWKDILEDMVGKTNVSQETSSQFMEHLSYISQELTCYGTSLSEDGDLLSQWRGYASDGLGYTVGFDIEKLKALPGIQPTYPSRTPTPAVEPEPLVLHKVAYDRTDGEDIVRPFLKSVEDFIQEGFPANWLATRANPEKFLSALNKRHAIAGHMLSQWIRLFSIKGPAWKEEQEWRLAMIGFPAAFDYSYRVTRNGLAPYFKYKLPDAGSAANPIAHVILGPKNPTREKIVQSFLRKYKHDIEIHRSAASYR